MEKAEVLIVGAGPTGLTMANLLAKSEVTFMLIDKSSGPAKNSKAFGIHARTLEVFHQIGIAEKCIQAGRTDNTIRIVVKGKVAAEFSASEIVPGKTRYPYFLILPQNETEQLLEEALEDKGHKVKWDHELLDLERHDSRVDAMIKIPGKGKSKMSFRYVIGCDGAESIVKEVAGFTFKGKTIQETFFLADCKLNWDLEHPGIYFIFSPNYLSAVFSYKQKDSYRFFNFLNPINEDLEKEDFSKENLRDLLDSDPYVKAKASEISWLSVFRIHNLYAENFRNGNIFIAGDAAHVHSPAGAQGMNTAIQDACNLAWKIALVIKGMASEKLLDTYNEERHFIAKNLYNVTDRFFRIMTNKSPLGNFFRINIFPALFRTLTSFETIRNKSLMRMSQLSVKYPKSSLNRKGRNAPGSNSPVAGQRVPYCQLIIEGIATDTLQLSETYHFSVIIAYTEENQLKAFAVKEFYQRNFNYPVKVYLFLQSKNPLLFKTWGITDTAVYIIRPDGHIIFGSSALETISLEF
jgi:2-polyprenyl-6-methoxyphenol hydroxylase-like FAD-dependent oxidoreductase